MIKAETMVSFHTTTSKINGEHTRNKLIWAFQHLMLCSQTYEIDYYTGNLLFLVVKQAIWPKFLGKYWPDAPIDPGNNPTFVNEDDWTSQTNRKQQESTVDCKEMNNTLIEWIIYLLVAPAMSSLQGNPLPTQGWLSWKSSITSLRNEGAQIKMTYWKMRRECSYNMFVINSEKGILFGKMIDTPFKDSMVVGIGVIVVTWCGLLTQVYTKWIQNNTGQRTFTIYNAFWKHHYDLLHKTLTVASQFGFGRNAM